MTAFLHFTIGGGAKVWGIVRRARGSGGVYKGDNLKCIILLNWILRGRPFYFASGIVSVLKIEDKEKKIFGFHISFGLSTRFGLTVLYCIYSPWFKSFQLNFLYCTYFYIYMSIIINIMFVFNQLDCFLQSPGDCRLGEQPVRASGTRGNPGQHPRPGGSSVHLWTHRPDKGRNNGRRNRHQAEDKENPLEASVYPARRGAIQLCGLW